MNVNLKGVFQPKFFGLFKKGKYDRQAFTSDLIAGVIVGIIALPLAIAFGRLHCIAKTWNEQIRTTEQNTHFRFYS